MGNFLIPSSRLEHLVPVSLRDALRRRPFLEADIVREEREREPDDTEPVGFPKLKHLSVLCSSFESGESLRGVPLYGLAEVLVLEPGQPEAPLLPQALPLRGLFVRRLLPLGTLGTDHRGYASWDLTRSGLRLRRRPTFAEYRLAVEIDGRLVEPDERVPAGLDALNDPMFAVRADWRPNDALVIRLLVLPWEDEQMKLDALAVGDIGAERIVVRHQLTRLDTEGRVFATGAVSIQSPSLLDWEISPSSFTLGTGQMIGADGCEAFLPPVLSTQQYHFANLLLGNAIVDPERDARSGEDRSIRLGYLHHYVAEWFHLGHSLGAIRHSIALAPAERTRIAVVEWSRRDTATREETQRFGESLEHAQRRDRDVTDTMTLALDEFQKGSSSQSGLGGAFGAAASFLGSGFGGVVSGALSAVFGSSESATEGHRDLAANSLQHVTDAIQQSSTSLRQLNATVVVEVGQAEASTATTRTVANYNHGHTLTIVYYEVLRHYRVLTRHLRTSPLVLVPTALPTTFDCALGIEIPGVSWGRQPAAAVGPFGTFVDVLGQEPILRRALLDPEVEPGFAALRRLRRAALAFQLASGRPAPVVVDPGDGRVDQVEAAWLIGRGSNTDARVRMSLLTTSDPVLVGSDVLRSRMGSNNLFDDSGDEPQPYAVVRQPVSGAVKLKDIVGVSFRLESDDDPFLMDTLRVTAFVGASSHVLLDIPAAAGGAVLKLSEEDRSQSRPTTTVGSPPPPPVPSILDGISAEDVADADRLIAHLDAHPEHYGALLLMALPSTERQALLAGIWVGGMPLASLVDDHVAVVHANMAGFTLSAAGLRALRALTADPTGISELLAPEVLEPTVVFEDLVSLPSRGVFAEAKLGHCNANEVIEAGRFWDWQISPIPDEAPVVAAASTDSRTASLTGPALSGLPTPIVNIATPQPLPEPNNLAEALRVIGSSAMFRDMSGKEALSGLLGRLGDDSAGLAASLANQAASNGRMALQKQVLDSSATPEEKAKLLTALGGEPAKTGASATSSAAPQSAAGAVGASFAAGGGGGSTTPRALTSDKLPTVKLLSFTVVPTGFDRVGVGIPAYPMSDGGSVSHMLRVFVDGTGRDPSARGPSEIERVLAPRDVVGGNATILGATLEGPVTPHGTARVTLYAQATGMTAAAVGGEVSLTAATSSPMKLSGSGEFQPKQVGPQQVLDQVLIYASPKVVTREVTWTDATSVATTLGQMREVGVLLGVAIVSGIEATVPLAKVIGVDLKGIASMTGNTAVDIKTQSSQTTALTTGQTGALKYYALLLTGELSLGSTPPVASPQPS